MTLFDISGKVALVTGGGRGLGGAIARGLAQAGAHVVVAGRSSGELDRIVDEAARCGESMSALTCDLTRPQAPTLLVERAVEICGALDILVHAAGTQVRKPLPDLTIEDWDRVTDLHLRAAFLLAQATVAHLRERKSGGKIVLIGSLTTHIGISNLVPYVSAKSAVGGLTRALAVELADHGICVNAIIPGYYRTALTDDLLSDPEKHDWVLSRIPMKRLGRPEDLVGAAVYLSSGASDYVTGTEIRVDGGWLAA